MTDLKEGLILTLDEITTGSFFYKGKQIKLEPDENNPLVFRGQTSISKDEEKAGNLNTAFVYNAGTAVGTLNTYQVIPDNDDFKDLNDAEKVTKLNSIEYQFGAEPTDDGRQLDHVLQNSVDTTPSQDKQSAKLQQKEKEKEQQKEKESSVATLKQPTDSNNNRETVKSGDNVKVSKEKQF